MKKTQMIKVHYDTKEDGAKGQGKMVESTWTNLQSQHWLQSRGTDSNMQTYSGNVRIKQMTIMFQWLNNWNLLNFSVTGQYFASCHHQKHVHAEKRTHRLYLGELLSDERCRESQNTGGFKLGGIRRRAGETGLICKEWSCSIKLWIQDTRHTFACTVGPLYLFHPFVAGISFSQSRCSDPSLCPVW